MDGARVGPSDGDSREITEECLLGLMLSRILTAITCIIALLFLTAGLIIPTHRCVSEKKG